MTERAGFEVECPCCHATFVATRPELPFRHATAESLAGPPDVRIPPKNPADHVVVCKHCGSEFTPARSTRNPRFCSKSCARRNVLARKHGLLEAIA